jgi:hypothetical protein
VEWVVDGGKGCVVFFVVDLRHKLVSHLLLGIDITQRASRFRFKTPR